VPEMVGVVSFVNASTVTVSSGATLSNSNVLTVAVLPAASVPLAVT